MDTWKFLQSSFMYRTEAAGIVQRRQAVFIAPIELMYVRKGWEEGTNRIVGGKTISPYLDYADNSFGKSTSSKILSMSSLIKRQKNV